MNYILKVDGCPLAKVDVKTGKVGFVVTNQEQAAIEMCKRLHGVLGKMSYKECKDEKELLEALGFENQNQSVENFDFKESDFRLPGEGKTIYNTPSNYYDGEGEQ